METTQLLAGYPDHKRLSVATGRDRGRKLPQQYFNGPGEEQDKELPEGLDEIVENYQQDMLLLERMFLEELPAEVNDGFNLN